MQTTKENIDKANELMRRTGGGGEEFKPTTGGQNLQSGEKLLVEAYAIIWVLAFALMFFSWRRQRALDTRVTELETLLARARKDAPPAKKSANVKSEAAAKGEDAKVEDG
jgi:hypothetical protein